MSKRTADPTDNVGNLVKAGRKADRRYQNGMRKELDKRLDMHADYIHRLKTQEFLMQDAARYAESRRIDEALRLRDDHDREKANLTARWADSTAQTISTTLAAIQATSSSRLDRLEQFMFTQSGKGQGVGTVWAVALGVATLASVGIALYAALH